MDMRRRDRSLVPAGYMGPGNMMREMEQMFDDFRLGFEDLPFRSTGTRLPVMDIRDEGKEYTVEAELPGLKKEDVSIEMGEDALIIKAEKENQQEKSGEGFVRKERGRVSFYRQVPMPMDVETSKATAKMEDGLLKITLPKKEKVAEAKKKLEIQ